MVKYRYVLNKLSSLWVSIGRGGAFLSCIAAATSLPINFMVFCVFTNEAPKLLSWCGMLLTFFGLGIYFRAAPEEFSSAGGLPRPARYGTIDSSEHELRDRKPSGVEMQESPVKNRLTAFSSQGI